MKNPPSLVFRQIQRSDKQLIKQITGFENLDIFVAGATPNQHSFEFH